MSDNIKLKHPDLRRLEAVVENINDRGGPYDDTEIDRTIWDSQLRAVRNLSFLGRGRHGFISMHRLSRFLWAFANDSAREYRNTNTLRKGDEEELDLSMTAQVNYIMTIAQEVYDENRKYGIVV